MSLYFKFYIILILLGESFSDNSFLDNKEDSLKILINSSSDTLKINLINELSREYYVRSFYDSAIKYANTALNLSDRNDYIKGKSKAHENLAETYYDLEEFEKSIYHYSKSIESKQILGDKKGEAYCLHVIAILYRKMNNLDKAIDYEFRSLKIAEEINDQRRIAYVSNGIGLIYQTLKQYKKALFYYDKFLKISLEHNDQTDIADAYNNIGTIYKSMNNSNQARVFYSKALELYKETNDKRGLALSYNNLGEIFLLKNKLDTAKYFQEKSLQIEIERNNREGIAYSYSSIADIYKANQEYDTVIFFLRKALQYTRENDLTQRIYDGLTEVYIIKGDPVTAIKYHNLSLSFKDTIYSRETKNIIAEIQTRYETEKKEREIQLLTKENEVQTLRLKKNNILLYSISGILVLIILLVIVVFYAYREKKNANLLLVQKNTEILNQKEEIEAQRDEISIQRDTLARQKKNITDSILYAQKIQQALLPTSEMLQTSLPEHFVLFRPRDIVSGDFYWLRKINNLVVLTVADCTGHGVPGAFMSMLGISFLNEIVNDKEVNTPGEVLKRMREKVKTSLHQKGAAGEQKDGMDMALCVLDTKTLLLQYAGAHNPLYLLRMGIDPPAFENPDVKIERNETHTLYEFKANRQPVSISQKERDFTTHEIQLLKGDTFYLFSDGFQDQLSGNAKEKFKPQRLKKILLDSAENKMDDQKQILETAHENWKRETDQVDDILIFGVRI